MIVTVLPSRGPYRRFRRYSPPNPEPPGVPMSAPSTVYLPATKIEVQVIAAVA